MYRTVEFNSAFSDDPKLDEHGQILVPGSRGLAEAIVSRLRYIVKSVSDIDQHEWYGWGFFTSIRNARFYNVLNPVGDECYLTVSMDWYWLKRLLLRRPKIAYEKYCSELTDVLRSIPEVSDISWQDYRC